MKKLITFFLYSLRGRMIAGVVLVHAVLMGLVVADMVSRQQAFMERQVARQGQSVATTLAVMRLPGCSVTTIPLWKNW